MQNKSRKSLDTIVSKTKIYLAIILVLLVFIGIENRKLIIPSILLFFFISLYSYYTNNKRKSELSETLQELTLTLDSAAKTSLINSPFPLIILEANGNIVWRSSKFSSEFADMDMNHFIAELSNEIKDEIDQRKKRKSRYFKAYGNWQKNIQNNRKICKNQKK